MGHSRSPRYDYEVCPPPGLIALSSVCRDLRALAMPVIYREIYNWRRAGGDVWPDTLWPFFVCVLILNAKSHLLTSPQQSSLEGPLYSSSSSSLVDRRSLQGTGKDVFSDNSHDTTVESNPGCHATCPFECVWLDLSRDPPRSIRWRGPATQAFLRLLDESPHLYIRIRRHSRSCDGCRSRKGNQRCADPAWRPPRWIGCIDHIWRPTLPVIHLSPMATSTQICDHRTPYDALLLSVGGDSLHASSLCTFGSVLVRPESGR